MRPATCTVLALALLAGTAALAADKDDPAEVIEAQKKKAVEHWASLSNVEPAHAETTHFLLYSVGQAAPQLKTIGDLLEREYPQVLKALQLDPKDEMWPGKMTVHVFTDRKHYTSFVRGVQKRRVESDDLGSFVITGNQPHLAAGVPTMKDQPSLELQASAQLAAALVAKKSGRGNVPSWVAEGLGRATAGRTDPRLSERSFAGRGLGKVKSLNDILSASDALSQRELDAVRASLVDYMAFGPYKAKFPQFLEGFRPERNRDKTIWDALKSCDLDAKTFEPKWRAWARSGR